MLNGTLRYCSHIRWFHPVTFLANNGIMEAAAAFGCRNYSNNKGSCCKDIAQTQGKRVEPWPKPYLPPPAWRLECPREPQPPNYDPYRIKVPDIACSPLPPSTAKWMTVLRTTPNSQSGPTEGGPQQAPEQPQRYGPYGQYPDYGQQNPQATEEQSEEESSPSTGFFGFLKGLFRGRGKTGKGEGEVSMVGSNRRILFLYGSFTLQPMLDCARTKGPCSVKPVPDLPPYPPPPPPPFPWIYVWSVLSFFGIMGLIYQLYLWKLEQDGLGQSVDKWRPRRKVKRPFHCKDLPACVQYLIIGGGAAGWAAYRAIMEHDKTAKVFFISKEDCIPYNQLPMSKHMWWNPEPPDIKSLNYIEDGRRHTRRFRRMYNAECSSFIDPVNFYRKKKGPAVSIATGWCVLRLDADDHVAWVKTMCGEQPIYYERCLVAPGAKPKNLSIFKSAPKAVRDRVCTLRTIRDLEVAYRKVKASKHVVIIGGGFLGSELAWHLGRMRKEVERHDDEEPIQFVQIFKDRGILAGVLPEYIGEWAAEKIKCEGVTLMPKTLVYDAFESQDGRLELTLSNGTSLVTDYVFVAIGTDPRTELAEPSFLELDPSNGGFLVNTELEARTHLYVAGDAASFYSQWKDTRLRTEHYGNAQEQGYVAGANMTGYWTPCNMEPHFYLHLGDEVNMEAVGEVGACMPTVALFKPCSEDSKPQAPAAGEGERPCFKKADEYKNRYKRGLLFYLRDETIVGMVFWNLPPVDDRYGVATEILHAKPSYKDINLIAELFGFSETKCDYLSEEQLKEPGPCIQNRRFA